METYKAGSGTSPISVSTDLRTIGLAGSRATLFVPGSDMPARPVAHSIDATGDIPVTVIGPASDVEGKRISIMSKIDLSIVGDTEAREREFNQLSASYYLEGGEEQSKEFIAEPEEITHAPDFMTALIYKAIDII